MQNLSAMALDVNDDPADRVSTINVIKPANWLCDSWDIPVTAKTFLPETVTHHTHGVNRGQLETRRFFVRLYPYEVTK